MMSARDTEQDSAGTLATGLPFLPWTKLCNSGIVFI